MILEYSVKNYTVFKETAHLSFVASNYDKTTLELENVEHVPQKRLRILRTAVVHGASSKSYSIMNKRYFGMGLKSPASKFFPNGCSTSVREGSIRFSTAIQSITPCRRMQSISRKETFSGQRIWCGTMPSCIL